MALTRLKSKPFTFTRTPNTTDSQYFRRELERVLDFVDQQFSALAVSETAAADIIPTSRGGFGINMSAIPQFAIPYATQPGKFGWQRSSAFSIGLLGRQSQAEWQSALGITSFGSMPPNTLLGRYDPAPGPTQVAGVGAGLLFDSGNLRVTDALLAFSAMTANDGDVMRYQTGMWGGQDLGDFFDDLIADPAAAAYDYIELPFTFSADKRLLGRDGVASTEISIGSALLLSGGVLNTGPQLAAIEALTTTSYGIGVLEMANAAALRTYIGLGTSAVLDAGVALGTATLDAGGKIPLSQIPDSVLGQVEYQGSWNASTNTPTLSTTPGSATLGHYYVTSVAGTFDGIDYEVGDWIISNGVIWQKVDNTDAVVSVAGRIGAINLFQADVSGLTTADTPVFTSVRLSGLTTNGVLRTTGGNGTLTVSAVLGASLGGTGQSTYSDGDLLYGNAGGLSKLAHPGLLNHILVTSFFGGLNWVDLGALAVTTLAGTANQVFVNGTSGSGQTGNLTLTLPQSIGTASNVQFGSINSTPIGATTPSTGAFTGVTVAPAGALGNITLGDGTSGSYSTITMRGNASQAAWQIASSNFSGSTLEFTPSTAAGGTTFTTPVVKINSTGLQGAIGATTPSTGAFTSLTSGAGGLKLQTATPFWLDGGGDTYFQETVSNQIQVVAGGIQSGIFTSTGFQGAIGATTPSTGVFSNLAVSAAGGSRLFHVAAASSYALATIESGGTNQSAYLELKPTGTGFGVLQINGSDKVLITSTGLIVVQQDSESLSIGRASTDGTIVGVRHGASFVGSISASSTSTFYNTSSDRRLKTNIRDFVGSAAIIDKIKPRIFDWKTGEKDTVGFVAQELYQVYAKAVTKNKDSWGVDFSKLVPILTAEIKSLRKRVAKLESN